ncbi:MAG: M23 family metallopeptidase [Spirulina sp. SIO3F2]|nr:M23 family metallopeptidase [Spirulina sp. SIO3F2]
MSEPTSITIDQQQLEAVISRVIGKLVSELFAGAMVLGVPIYLIVSASHAQDSFTSIPVASGDINREPKVGEIIGRAPTAFPVTDIWGSSRDGGSRKHKGLDIATPTGTPVYLANDGKPATVSQFFDDYKGAQDIRCEYIRHDGVVVQLLHMQACYPGEHQPGEVIGLTGTAGTGPHLHMETEPHQKISFSLAWQTIQKSEMPMMAVSNGQLFATLDSPGLRAIGYAEGTLTLEGKPTQAYWGHSDPGNFRRNQGWCSDQGRGGGNVELANQKCLERVQQRLELIKTDLQAAQLNPETQPLVLVNTVDLYNQASPWVSRQFPAAYRRARQQGLNGEQAIVWARVEAFRRRGKIDASGLIGICQREGRRVSDWDCVAADQRRRVQAISAVLTGVP